MGKQAFDGPRLNGFWLDPLELMIVGIDTKKDVGGEEHFLYDPRVNLPLDEAFVLNVMALGVKKPVIVTKIDGEPYVVDGRQRVRAARAANERLAKMGEKHLLVPIIQQVGEEPLIMTVAVSTNEFNVQDSPLARARKARKLLDRGQTEDQVAVAFGVTRKAVQNWMKLLGLSSPVLKAVDSGKISAHAAAQLADLTAEVQKASLEKLLGDSSEGEPAPKPTAKATRREATRSSGGSDNIVPSKKVLRYLVENGAKHHLNNDFVFGIRYALGLINDLGEVKGLIEAVAQAHHTPAKKRG